MPEREMRLPEAEGWLDYWETVGLSSDPAALDEREAARVIRAELKRLRAALTPRVWFDGEDIPPSVRVIDEMGDIHWPGEDCYPGELCRMVGFGPVVEVLLPDHSAAVAAERERRALLGAGETTEADQ